MTGGQRAMVAWTVAGLCLAGFAPVAAQDPRDSLIRRAFSEADPMSRLRILVPALNPAAGPTGEAWSVGVQLLTQTLLDQGRDSAAAVWLRWAIRVEHGFQVDTLQFPPRLVAAFQAAREFVLRTSVPEDAAGATRWDWPAHPGVASAGRLLLALAGVEQVLVEGIGPLTAGAPLDLAPGSYRIIAAMGEGPVVTLTREVLPGITTLLELTPPPVVVGIGAPAAAQPPTPELVVSPRRFPWRWAALGAVGAAALTALLAGGRDGKPGTGGIIITLPGP